MLRALCATSTQLERKREREREREKDTVGRVVFLASYPLFLILIFPLDFFSLTLVRESRVLGLSVTLS